MDISHYSCNGFLTLNDCGPTRFTVWYQLARQDALAIVRGLKSIFFERDAPAEILTDYAPAFCSQNFLAFTDEWGTRMQYRSAYVPEGNGITEQCHRIVKLQIKNKWSNLGKVVVPYTLVS